MEIRELIKLHREQKESKSNFYSDSDIVDAVDHYINEYFVKKAQKNTSWKVAHNSKFKDDVERLSVKELAMRYNLTYHGAYYHKKKNH